MGKSMKKSKQGAQRKNAELNQVLLKQDTEALFGRTIKKLGNGHFRILTTDNDGRGTEVNAVIMGKSVVRIEIGDVIVVGKNESAGKACYEILGSVDKKTTQQLREAKRFHPSLFSEVEGEGDDLFDRSADAAPEEESAKAKVEKGNKPLKKDKALLEDGEVDVDAI